MGFASDVSRAAVREHETVQSAVDAILAGKGQNPSDGCVNYYMLTRVE